MDARIENLIGSLTEDETAELACAALNELPLEMQINVILEAVAKDDYAELAAHLEP